ncbi:hypothetical protein EYC80_004979 [Monilinia laxa]|uniref:Uncharacterized protein n=1 Tax=Monilinia laxa TaxID=61186 RepID=A0A5N6KK64_MONLA|nr:hypothetical protein EYC80_004979 [Monilinia laxa]
MKRGNDISTFLEYRSERDIDIDDPRVLIEVDEDEDEAEIDLHTCDHYKPNRRESKFTMKAMKKVNVLDVILINACCLLSIIAVFRP